LIVDSFEPWRRTVRSILAGDLSIKVVGECSNGLDCVRKADLLRPDLVLLDVQLEQMNGFMSAQQIAKISPNTKILFLCAHNSLRELQEALGIGAGFILKERAKRELLPAIRAVVEGRPVPESHHDSTDALEP
jgi:DNA-binding NarL/FixJ family response regulator